MKVRVANCPSCGGPVEFQVSTSLVTICDFCQCVVARADKSVADHGKVSDLVLTDSPLSRGVTGKCRGKKFELVGRVQYQHPAGGVWDEWYLLFSNGRWGWLAEAQGKYYLMSQKKAFHKLDFPEFDDLEPGRRLKLGKKEDMTVTEVGVAVTKAAEGEIPWTFQEGIPHRFVDFRGQGRTFGTLDYSLSEPRLFLGRELTLDELGLSETGWYGGVPAGVSQHDESRVQALSVNCPHCAGALTLHAPDETQRVCCPSCASLLDCQKGKLEYLQTLHTRRKKPQIPLGTVGTLDGVEYTVIGFMERFARYQGLDYPWTEYLLRSQRSGYRWLVCNKRHWSFVEPVSAHEVSTFMGSATYDNQKFSRYDLGTATVRFVLGEFYWKVTVGDMVHTVDYIAPPLMLSSERSESDDSQELNVSLGVYKSTEEIEQAFGITDLVRPWGVGVIQPAPRAGDVMKLWAMFLVVLGLLDLLFLATLKQGVDQWFFATSLGLASLIPIGFLFYKYQFEVNRWKDSDFSPYATE
ncbi:MAG: DUF4178 domain-containing protein [Fuerstiella sp.]|nr:DUF4178 domain-containing protein [Fuerstiella sp.]